MRDRHKQKELYLQGLYRETRLDRKNEYGNDDLTPQEAVDRIIWKEKVQRLHKMGITVTSAFGASLLGGG